MITQLKNKLMKRLIAAAFLLFIAVAFALSHKNSTPNVTNEESATSNYQNLEVKYDLSFFKPF